MQEAIRNSLSTALAAIGISVEAEKIPLEFTGDLAHGDFASSIAMQCAKDAGMAPRELAAKIVELLRSSTELGPTSIQRIEVAGPGFINFYLDQKVFADTLQDIISDPSSWGRNDVHEAERVMIEFTDPNPFKEFHIGHLMSNAIGESIARLMEYASAKVLRANYQGDVGPHVAKAIWGVQKLGVDPHDSSALGKAYAAGAAAYENDEKAKVEMDAINTKIYDRTDENVNEIYAAGREASLEHFEEIYKTLGTKFDHYFFESETAPRGMRLVEKHKDVFAESDGAIVYKGEQDGLHTRVFITSRGTPTYETKDLGLLELKGEQGKIDESITVTAHEQADYFKVMLAAAKHLPEVRDIASKTKHVTHGMMRLAEGKMSSRTGNVITGESLLADVAEAAKVRAAESRADDPEQLSQDIAVAAIKYQILRQASGKDIIFDRERALSLEGDSGPYMQYTYARASQVMARARGENVKIMIYHNSDPIDLVRLMYRFPGMVERSARELEPHTVANFLIEFAAAFNRWYAEVRIVDTSTSSAQVESAHKVAITEAARITLKNGLYLLGIPAPEKM
ncbi:arginine--tRNA ligase [Candidatus Parcubacteria bacterium]|nr:MAG: arginine--tRNA ligase [Candidatus Parcubacteria bacterium]